MADDPVIQAAQALVAAERSATPIGRVSAQPWDIQADDAYKVQFEGIRLGTEMGVEIVGYKVGLTSRGMQDLLGVSEPDFGHLRDDMAIPLGSALTRSELVQPRAEPELAFVLGAPLGAVEVQPADVLQATAHVCPAIEVVDSRIADWDITWTDTVADNGSSARFILGQERAPVSTSVKEWRTTLRKNGEIVGDGPLSEVMGDPIRAVAWLASSLFRLGIVMQPGQVILSGSPCAAVYLDPGDRVEAQIESLGAVALDVV